MCRRFSVLLLSRYMCTFCVGVIQTVIVSPNFGGLPTSRAPTSCGIFTSYQMPSSPWPSAFLAQSSCSVKNSRSCFVALTV